MLKSGLADTIKNIERNNLMSFASVISVVAALLILGAFIMITMNVESITGSMVSSLELKVFLNDDATPQDTAQLEQDLMNNPHVTNVVFESKDEALSKYSAQLDQYSGLLSGFNAANNPVSNSYTVAVTSPEELKTVKEEVEDLHSPAVDYVKYGEEYIDAMVSFSRFLNYICLGVLIILSVICIVIIYNTIKLTCYANRKEIEIMKVVGADDWYIRMPFFLEGCLLGIIGAAAATLILRTVYLFLIGISNTLAYLPMNSHLVAPDYVITPIFWFSLIYGILMGAFGSLFSIRKYLFT